MMDQAKEWLVRVAELETWWQTAGPGAQTFIACMAFGLCARIMAASIPARSVSLWMRPVVIITMVAAPVFLFPFLASTGNVDPEISNPMAALRIQGGFFSMVAVVADWCANRWIYGRFIQRKYDGNTEFITREKPSTPIAGDGNE